MKRIKNAIKHILYFLTTFLPHKTLRKISNRNLLVINYHSIYGVDPDSVINNNIYRTSDQFEQDIIFLKRYYHFVKLPEVIDYVLNEIPLPKNSVLLTFDDGLKVVFDHIRPILLKYKVTALFFINPCFVDNNDLHFQRKKNLILQSIGNEEIARRRDNWEKVFSNVGIEPYDFYEALKRIQYKESSILNSLFDLFHIDLNGYLKKNQIYLNSSNIEQMIKEGFYFGGHSMDHPKYDELSYEEQLEQTQKSIIWVKDKFKLDYSIFAFPLRDHQISQKLFKAIQSNCEVSFGVMGIGDDVIQNHIQRIDVESTGAKIDRVLKLEYVKFLFRKLSGMKHFKRPI